MLSHPVSASSWQVGRAGTADKCQTRRNEISITHYHRPMTCVPLTKGALLPKSEWTWSHGLSSDPLLKVERFKPKPPPNPKKPKSQGTGCLGAAKYSTEHQRNQIENFSQPAKSGGPHRFRSFDSKEGLGRTNAGWYQWGSQEGWCQWGSHVFFVDPKLRARNINAGPR